MLLYEALSPHPDPHLHVSVDDIEVRAAHQAPLLDIFDHLYVTYHMGLRFSVDKTET